MKKLFEPGDKSQAICWNCEALKPTTFAYRSVPFDDGKGKVDNILVSVCDTCGETVSVPAQSTPAIRRSRETANLALEVSLRASELDILDAAAYAIDHEATARFRKPIIAYYLRRLLREEAELEQVRDAFPIWLEHRKTIYQRCDVPKRRLSFKVAPRTQAQLIELQQKTGWRKTNLVRSIIMQAGEDIIGGANAQALSELRQISALINA